MMSFASEAAYMCLLPILIYLFWAILSPVSWKFIRSVSRPWKIISLIFSFLYLLMASFTEVLKDRFPLPLKIALLILCFICCCLLLFRVGTIKLYASDTAFQHIGKSPVYAAIIPITLLSIFIISGCFPGVFSSDSMSNWVDVSVNAFSDWHPVTYLYILKVIQRIFGTPFPLVLLQTLLWILANQYALYLLEKYSPIKGGDILYTAFSIIMLYSYRALGNIEKDTLWNIGLFLFCIILFDFIKAQESLRWYKILLFLIAAGIVSTIRHMGNLIVILSLLALAFYEWKIHGREYKTRMKQVVSVLLFSIIIPILLVNILGSYILHMTPNENYVKYSVPISMAGAVASKENLEQEDIEILEEVMPIEKWRDCYDKYYADSLSRTWGAIGEDALKFRDKDFQKDILLLNAKFLVKYPVTYLTAYFDMTSIIWEMGTPSDGYEWIPITIYSSALDQYPGYSDLQIKPTFSTTIQQNFFGIYDQFPIWSSICWRGGFSVFVLLVCSSLLVKKKRAPELLALFPALLLTVVLFLANPSQDPRYIDSYHMLMCFFLISASS